MTMTSSVSLALTAPPHFPPISSLPHCKGSSSTTEVPEQLDCSFWDTAMLVTSRGDRSLSVATFFEVTNQTRPTDPGCVKLANPGCAYTDIASQSYFVAAPELLFLILKVEALFTGNLQVHTITLDRTQGSICDESNSDIAASTVGVCAADEVDPCDSYTSLGLDCPEEVEAGSAIPLATLLKAATGSSNALDEKNDKGVVDRRGGIKLQLLIEFTNSDSSSEDDISYVIRPRVVRASAGNSLQRVQSFPTGPSLPAFAPQERSKIKIGNLQVEVATASDVSYKSISQAFVVLMSAFGFVATFRTIFQALIPHLIDQRNANHVEYTLSNVALCARCASGNSTQSTHAVEAPHAIEPTDSEEVQLTPKRRGPEEA